MWGKIELEKWRGTPCITNRVATEDDIKNGVAVFAIPSGSKPYNAPLPLCAVQTNEETGDRVPCIAIQIEEADDGVFIGVRYLDGGNGVGTPEDTELYEEPTSDFPDWQPLT